MASVSITFRSNRAELLPRVDAHFRPEPPLVMETEGHTGVTQPEVIDVEVTAQGGVLVEAHDHWDFPHLDQFFLQLTDITNEYAARGSSYAALHAGAVRTPGGRILGLIGPIDSGKSTSTAALVAGGCDYITDETVGYCLKASRSRATSSR